jgi:phenylalanine-4-hydroxylase
MTRGSSPAVPEHLRRFVVEQDYDEYDAVDQAVWRFVLLQLSSRLGGRAHPAYQRGLAATGISVDYIPSIAEMNEKLARFGWGAVCVDGFIPPRAFQEFQAAGLLPIAAEIRTRAHLVYTPAPDIIHEAAGHAPILPDPTYAAYLRRIGEVGASAFTLPEDHAVHDATHLLSEVKEDPSATPEQVAAADAALERALAAAGRVSEAARLSRLYWWTAEYGLVGSPSDYRLYGAGLLSSLGESHSCHAPTVRKIPLDEACLEVAYDITRPQPQLFVAPSFEALHGVLDRVEQTLAKHRGGAFALASALSSAELATVRFDSGARVFGVLRGVTGEPNAPALLEFEGPAALALDGAIIPGHGADRYPDGFTLPVGRLASGESLDSLSAPALERRTDGERRLRFDFARGAKVSGRFERALSREDGRTLIVELSDAVLEVTGVLRHFPHFSLLAAGEFVTAEAGVRDPSFHAPTQPPKVKVPRPRQLNLAERTLGLWYERVRSVRAAGNTQAEQLFAEVERALAKDYPREWLLRFVMLEDLTRRGLSTPLAEALRRTLERLEVDYAYEQPIASGLAYLARRVA